MQRRQYMRKKSHIWLWFYSNVFLQLGRISLTFSSHHARWISLLGLVDKCRSQVTFVNLVGYPARWGFLFSVLTQIRWQMSNALFQDSYTERCASPRSGQAPTLLCIHEQECWRQVTFREGGCHWQKGAGWKLNLPKKSHICRLAGEGTHVRAGD